MKYSSRGCIFVTQRTGFGCGILQVSTFGSKDLRSLGKFPIGASVARGLDCDCRYTSANSLRFFSGVSFYLLCLELCGKVPVPLK